MIRRWLEGRKFGLTVAVASVACMGGVWLYWNTPVFSERLEVYNDTMEWVLYTLLTFCGVEGTLDAMKSMKKKTTIKDDN